MKKLKYFLSKLCLVKIKLIISQDQVSHQLRLSESSDQDFYLREGLLKLKV